MLGTGCLAEYDNTMLTVLSPSGLSNSLILPAWNVPMVCMQSRGNDENSVGLYFTGCCQSSRTDSTHVTFFTWSSCSTWAWKWLRIKAEPVNKYSICKGFVEMCCGRLNICAKFQKKSFRFNPPPPTPRFFPCPFCSCLVISVWFNLFICLSLLFICCSVFYFCFCLFESIICRCRVYVCRTDKT